jgi:antitoxin MazE
MQVFRWGNSLAVRLPKKLVEALNLSPDDELDVVEASRGQFTVRKIDKRSEFLAQMEAFRFPLPKDYRSDRNDSDER